MKESKKRDNSSSKKKKHSSSPLSLDSWNHTNLEEESEQSLEMRRHLLKLQLAQEGTSSHDARHSSTKRKKKHISEEVSSDSDSSHSGSSFSSASSSSVNKYKSKKSSSFSEDEKRKLLQSSLPKKKHAKEVKNSRRSPDFKTDKKSIIRKKASPIGDKSSSRGRSRKSPSLDKRDLYNRLDTGRWHEKAKEFEKERSKGERDRSRTRSRADRSNRSVSMQRESRLISRTKEDRLHSKKLAGRIVSSSSVTRRKDSPESARTRATYDTGRRTTVIARKLSPRDERLGRHDERRLDLKVTRRNDIRSGDLRDVNLRILREVRDRKEPPLKLLDKGRERQLHREIVDHSRLDRDRCKANEDRFKERDKRLLHDRLETERGLRSGARDLGEDKFRRNERCSVVDTGRLGNNRHLSGGESVFDRMRNRYNDRRNAENQRLGRERASLEVRKDRPPLEKDPLKARPLELNGAGDRLASRDRRLNLAVAPPSLPPSSVLALRSSVNVAERRSSPPPHRDRKEPERNTIERRSPLNQDRNFSNFLNSRRSRDLEHRPSVKRRSSLDNDDPAWARKKGMNKLRSRSRSSEKRKRRRSSQEEWRVIDMTSPVLDDEFSDENVGSSESMQNKLKRSALNKLIPKIESANDADKLDNTNLNDELSDISDEEFNDVNSTNVVKIKKEVLVRNDRVVIKNEENCRKSEQKISSDREDFDFEKTSLLQGENKHTVSNDVDDLIKGEKLTDEEENEPGVEIDKGENFDSEEETVSRVSDALGVDWADLVEESKKKAWASGSDQTASNVRRRWNTTIVFAKVGVSEKYAGEDVFNDLQVDLDQEVASENSNAEDCRLKILHKIPAMHTCLKIRAVKRQTLFEPYKTAISARKDIAIRRRLCGLPVKNLPSQQIIGICHWIV